MKFRYVGDSPNGPFEMYGANWETGSINDVTDGWAIGKLKGNAFFECLEHEENPVEVLPPRRGRPRKIDVEAESQDDGDQN